MQSPQIDRREFVKSGAVLAGLVATGRLPLLGAESGNGSGIDADTGPGAVKSIRRHLAQFEPVEGDPVSGDSYTLTYDILHWNDGLRRGSQRGSAVVGSLEIVRRGGKSRVRYEVAQETRFGGLDNILEAEIICATDELNTLRSWEIRTHNKLPKGEKLDLSEMSETGEVKAGRIRVKGGATEYDFTAANPVVSQWTLLDFVARRASPSTSASFDLLQDLSLFKANQELVFDGTTDVPMAGERTVKLATYSQTGEGVLPIHYLLDEQRRVQLVTQSLVSWALSGIS